MAGTDDISHAIAACAKRALPDFRYYKTHTQARREGKGVVDDVIFNVTRHDRGRSYTLWLFFGVQHKEVERVIAAAAGRKVDGYSRTVFQNSVNISPAREMQFEGQTVWDGLTSPDDASRIQDSVTHFLTHFVLPYHSRFHSLAVAREHLARNDGWVLNHRPYTQVLAIDALEGATHRAAAYLESIQRQKDGGYAWNLSEFNGFYESLRTTFPDTLPPFTLT